LLILLVIRRFSISNDQIPISVLVHKLSAALDLSSFKHLACRVSLDDPLLHLLPRDRVNLFHEFIVILVEQLVHGLVLLVLVATRLHLVPDRIVLGPVVHHRFAADLLLDPHDVPVLVHDFVLLHRHSFARLRVDFLLDLLRDFDLLARLGVNFVPHGGFLLAHHFLPRLRVNLLFLLRSRVSVIWHFHDDFLERISLGDLLAVLVELAHLAVLAHDCLYSVF